MSLDYVRSRYRVPARVGGPITYKGQPGRIAAGVGGGYLMLQLDADDTVTGPYHPTWEIEYAEENGPASRVPLIPAGIPPAACASTRPGESLWSGT